MVDGEPQGKTNQSGTRTVRDVLHGFWKFAEVWIAALVVAVVLDALRPFGFHIDAWVESGLAWVATFSSSISSPPHYLVLNLLFFAFAATILVTGYLGSYVLDLISLRVREGRTAINQVRFAGHRVRGLQLEARQWLWRLLTDEPQSQRVPAPAWKSLEEAELVEVTAGGLKRIKPDLKQPLSWVYGRIKDETLQRVSFVSAGILLIAGTIYATYTGQVLPELLPGISFGPTH